MCQTVWNPDPNFLVFSSSKEFAKGAEQFRTLRSRLYRIRESKPLSILLVSSATPAEGKTFVSANLRKFWPPTRLPDLVDRCRYARPKLHQLLGAPSGPGLAEYLQGELVNWTFYKKAKRTIFTLFKRTTCHPSVRIDLERAAQTTSRPRLGSFRLIIVDSPPILPVSDAAVLATMCHGVLFVVRAGLRLPQSRKSLPGIARCKYCWGGVEPCGRLCRIWFVLQVFWLRFGSIL